MAAKATGGGEEVRHKGWPKGGLNDGMRMAGGPYGAKGGGYDKGMW